MFVLNPKVLVVLYAPQYDRTILLLRGVYILCVD